ncbi:polysaccharide pyruvyl transferase family protein [Nonlabens antarcticus]|uniref:polysaccharide pyruvyl transferase family protein n=1 Tax=Nonlabens antarcticus TaxID=392714 RepID=UPI001891A81A|nr:polysaccharide pyruvyl transferase family protein [Nonlabens antarcticus]
MASDIRLYWWSEIFIQKKCRENYGDLLGKYLAEKISGKNATWVRASKFYIKNVWQPVYVTIGSILEHVGRHCIVWGSGINHRDSQIANATFMAVRGPLSRKRLLDLGYNCPEVYGDPALLLPRFYQPKGQKQFKLGIIPHISDYKQVSEMYNGSQGIKVIDFNTNDIEQTTDELCSCEQIISSSLHGVIVAHAYGIPAVQVQFSHRIYGDGVKYHDYFLSVGLAAYNPYFVEEFCDRDFWVNFIEEHPHKLPNATNVEKLQNGLMDACPFKAERS